MKYLEILSGLVFLVETVLFAYIFLHGEKLQIPWDMQSADRFSAERYYMIDMLVGGSPCPPYGGGFADIPWRGPFWRCLISPSTPFGASSGRLFWMGFIVCKNACYCLLLVCPVILNPILGSLFEMRLIVNRMTDLLLFLVCAAVFRSIGRACIRMCLAIYCALSSVFFRVSLAPRLLSLICRVPSFGVGLIICPLPSKTTRATFAISLPLSSAAFTTWLHASDKIKYKLVSHFGIVLSRLVRGASSVCRTEGVPIYTLIAIVTQPLYLAGMQ